ncbi:MAG: hypothetical protein JNJ54_05315 [Myxococcaceae bacterium]|nr:hypothetical protein [Myxococcaceae bacterium]
MLLVALTLALSAAPSAVPSARLVPAADDGVASSRPSLFVRQPAGTVARMTGAGLLAPAVTLGSAWLLVKVPLEAAWAAQSGVRWSSSGLAEGLLIGVPVSVLTGVALAAVGAAVFTVSLAVVSALGAPEFLRTFKKALLPAAGMALLVVAAVYVVALIANPLTATLAFGGVALGISAAAGAAVPLITALTPDAPERRGVPVARF